MLRASPVGGVEKFLDNISSRSSIVTRAPSASDWPEKGDEVALEASVSVEGILGRQVSRLMKRVKEWRLPVRLVNAQKRKDVAASKTEARVLMNVGSDF